MHNECQTNETQCWHLSLPFATNANAANSDEMGFFVAVRRSAAGGGSWRLGRLGPQSFVVALWGGRGYGERPSISVSAWSMG